MLDTSFLKPPFLGLLNSLGFNRSKCPQWISHLEWDTGSHYDGLPFYNDSNLDTSWHDHTLYLANKDYVIYLSSPYRSIEELNHMIEHSSKVIPTFKKHGFSVTVIPSIYHHNMKADIGGLYGTLLFIRHKTKQGSRQRNYLC